MIRRKIVLGPVAVLILAATAARSSRDPKVHVAHAPQAPREAAVAGSRAAPQPQDVAAPLAAPTTPAA